MGVYSFEPLVSHIFDHFRHMRRPQMQNGTKAFIIKDCKYCLIPTEGYLSYLELTDILSEEKLNISRDGGT